MHKFETKVTAPISMKDHIVAAFGYARFPAGKGAEPTGWNDKILIDATDVIEGQVHIKVSSEDDSQRVFVYEALNDAGLNSRSVGETIRVQNTPEVPLMKIER